MAHRDLGEYHLSVGDYNSALKSYAKSREFCTVGQHIIDMCLSVLQVSNNLEILRTFFLIFFDSYLLNNVITVILPPMYLRRKPLLKRAPLVIRKTFKSRLNLRQR